MSEYKPIDECRTVEELLSDPARWTQGAFARHADGIPDSPSAVFATCWCIAGAIAKVYSRGKMDGGSYHEMRLKMLEVTDTEGLAEFNDAPERTHAEVLEAVRRAGI